MKGEELSEEINGIDFPFKRAEVLEELDEEQRAAVTDEGGTSLVVAGPGSGKTKTITHKIAYLVSKGIKPYEILLVTFTRAAAKEMIRRARIVSQSSLEGMLAGTFHHICNYLLRRYSNFLHLGTNFSILDEEDSESLIRQVRAKVVKRGEKFPSVKLLRKIFSLSTNLEVDVEDVVWEKFYRLSEVLDRVIEIKRDYDEMKNEQNALDFDDLLVYANQLLDVEEVKTKESSRFKWVLVDEFQDTNRIQYEIVKKLSSIHGNLMVVGDDAQSIYSFRGARYENIFDLSRETGVKVYKIQTNYRSTPEIVSLVNVSIPNNVFQKKLRAVKPHGERPVVVNAWDSREEAEFICNKVEELVRDGLDMKEVAILYRAHSHSVDLQFELSKRRIPFRVRSGTKFVQSRHVKDVMAFLRIVNNPKDEVSWSRALQLFTGIGRKGAKQVFAFTHDDLSAIRKIGKFGRKYEEIGEFFSGLLDCGDPESMVKYVYEGFYSDYIAMTFPDFKDRQADIIALVEIAKRYDDVTSFLSDLAITEDEGVRQETSEKITLTTVHQAKGLEWDTVFILSLNVGDFPSFMGIKSGSVDEERRIFYVAITRAKNRLYLCRRLGNPNPYFVNDEEYDFVENLPPSLYESVSAT